MTDKKVLIFLAILVLTATIAGVGCGRGSANANANANTQPTIVDVTTAQATVKPIPTYFEATGNLAGDGQSDVAPTVAGKIVEVNFDVGSFVERGSVLVRLDDRDARIRIEQAQAQVEQQKKAIDQAVATLRQAQIRLGLRDGQSFDIATFSQVKSVTAQLVLAEKELARAQKLYDTGDVSKSILDTRRSQRDALIGQLDEARSNAAVAVRQINSAEAAVATAKSGIRTAQAQVELAQKSLSDTVIYAPISGYVSERTADPGEYLSPQAPNTKIGTIVRTSPLRLKIDVPEASIGKVAVGQGISLQTSAYPDRNFAGTVARILPNLNVAARTLTVEAEVANPDGLLKPGQFATVRITQSKPENAVMIPATAVRAEGDTNKVYVVKDGAVREILVQTGLLENGLIQIKQGLKENDVIATSNINTLYDGVLVRVAN